MTSGFNSVSGKMPASALVSFVGWATVILPKKAIVMIALPANKVVNSLPGASNLLQSHALRDAGSNWSN